MSSASPIFLKKHADYQAAYAIARKGRTPLLGWFAAARPCTSDPAGGARIGLTVPKALGKAVDRNRIKRRMRAAVLQQSAALLATPVDLILHPRRTVLDCEFGRLVGEIEKALQDSARAGGPSTERPSSARSSTTRQSTTRPQTGQP